MKKIENQFVGRGEVSGITFTLLERVGLESIWERSDGYFETVRLIERKSGTGKFGDNIVHFEAKESYPSGESWGINSHGQCLSNKEKAYEIFKGRVESDTRV